MQAPDGAIGYRVKLQATQEIEDSVLQEALKDPKVAAASQTVFNLLSSNGHCEFKIDLFSTGKGEAESEVLEAENHQFSILKKGCNEKFNSITLVAKSAVKADPGVLKASEDCLISSLSLFAEALQTALQKSKRQKLQPVEPEVQAVPKSPPITMGSQVFTSDIYKSFITQVRSFTEALLIQYPSIRKDERIVELTRHIDDPRIEDRQIFEFFIDSFRSIIKENKDPTVEEFIGKWVVMFFTEVNLEDAWKGFLFKLLGDFKVEPGKPLSVVVGEVEDILTSKKLKEALAYLAFSQLSAGNLVSRLWSSVCGNGRQAQFIRMANCSTFDGKLVISPEFIKMLQELQKQGKRFLYINMMYTSVEWAIDAGSDEQIKHFENEVTVTTLLHRLESEYGLTNLDVVSLDRNSEFYLSQSWAASVTTPEIKNAEFFKKHCFNNLFSQKVENPCIWPKRLDLSRIKTKAKEIIDNVHLKYFKNADSLTDIERNIFNELVMKDLVKVLRDESSCDYYTIACQASIDRGPSLATLHYWEDVIQRGQSKNPQEILRTVVMFFVNSILISNRLPHSQRIKTFIETLRVMEGVEMTSSSPTTSTELKETDSATSVSETSDPSEKVNSEKKEA